MKSTEPQRAGWLRKIVIGGFLLALAVLGVGVARAAEVWIMPPPWPGNGQCLREMLDRESEWGQTRCSIHGIGYWPWLLNQHFNDDEIRILFAKLKTWKLKFGLEVPVLKAAKWGGDGQPLQAKDAFVQLQQFAARFKSLGMEKVAWFAFDEPLYAARHVISSDREVQQRLAHGVAETTAFIAMLRRAYPGARLGDIEPYPAFTYDEITGAIENVQETCVQQGLKGLDFLRLDVDWDRMDRKSEGCWAEVKRVEDWCHSRGMGFSLIYWSANQPRLDREGQATPGVWRTGLLLQGREYAQVGGMPDQVVIESWLHVPSHAVPETDPDTFTGSVRAFLQSYRPR
jgi:hypothetical protein